MAGAKTLPKEPGLDDPRRTLLRRVAASESFAKSPRLRELLIYLTESALRNPSSALSEQQVGAAVFNRKEDYDTGYDSIVRVQVSEVRKRLKYYFLSEGLHEPLVMEVPNRSYLPVFTSRENLEIVQEKDAPATFETTHDFALATTTAQDRFLFQSQALPRPKPVARLTLLAGLASLLGVVIVLCGWLAYENTRLRRASAETRPFLSQFWKQFLQNGTQIEVVPSDISLIDITDVLGRAVSLKEYSDPKYPSPMIEHIAKDPKIRYFWGRTANWGGITPFDAPVLNDLSSLLGHYQIPFQVVSPRTMRADLDSPSSIILLGPQRANPWVEMFEGRMNFRYQFDDTTRRGTIINASPERGEKTSYPIENAGRGGYAVVAYLPKPDKAGNVLILFGGNLRTIDGAGYLVTDEAAMAKLYSTLGSRPADRIPYFEVLLEKKPTARNYEIIAYRRIKDQ